jgi:hypothetical protein
MTGASEALLSCPFCGGDPITEFACTPDGDGAYFVHCQHEGCPAWPNSQGETEAEAISAWNTRATAPLLDAIEAARVDLSMGLVTAALTRLTAELKKHGRD